MCAYLLFFVAMQLWVQSFKNDSFGRILKVDFIHTYSPKAIVLNRCIAKGKSDPINKITIA